MDTTLISTPVANTKRANSAPMSQSDCVCPTCWVQDGPDAALALPGDPAPIACPTCGVASVEWAMTCQMDDILDELGSFERLSTALYDVR